jgi:hypothetical protein
MKKLRLLVTDKCDRNCPLCVNKQWNLDELPVEDNYSQYSEIILTGGEPMLDPHYLEKVIKIIRRQTRAKIYVHTAKIDDYFAALNVLNMADGITVTIHETKDIEAFFRFDEFIPPYFNKSLRVVVFQGILNIESFARTFPKWDVKQINWIKDCPLPEGEVFKRFAYPEKS